MTRVRKQPLLLILSMYLAGGVAIGLLTHVLSAFAGDVLGRRGIGVAISVNLLMPAYIVLFAAAYPLARAAFPGALLATLGFVVALSRTVPALSAAYWTGLAAAAPPVLVVACVMYQILSAVTLLVARDYRRIIPPHSGVRNSDVN